MIQNCKEFFELIYNAYFKKDVTYLYDLSTKSKKALYTQFYSVLSKVKGNEAIFASAVREIMRNIQLTRGPIVLIDL
jgi:hypothetical protein